MRTFLTVAALLVLVSEPSWAQNFSQFGLPSARQYYLPPTYQYFTPPPRANRRVPPQAAGGQKPPPEKAAESRGGAKSSIGIGKSHSKLLFCEQHSQDNTHPREIAT